jgi:hypothetical protein
MLSVDKPSEGRRKSPWPTQADSELKANTFTGMCALNYLILLLFMVSSWFPQPLCNVSVA